MATEPITKSPAATPEKPAKPSLDRFHPEMPHIPGVGNTPTASRGNDPKQTVKIIGIVSAGLVVVLAIVWWARKSPRTTDEIPAPDATATESSAPIPPPPPVAPVQEGPTIAAKVEELSTPWAAKKFVFAKPLTHERVDAMVIRLPGGSLWAFSLQEPYGSCELQFVTDLAQIAAKYGYRASHPMVVNPCNSTVYDPLKVGSIGGDVWVRGEIVQGGGLRPPIAIDVQAKGGSVIADRIE